MTDAKTVMEKMVEMFDTGDVSAVSSVVAPERAAARLRWHHRNADGTVVERETIDVVRCADGKAVEHWGAETFRR